MLKDNMKEPKIKKKVMTSEKGKYNEGDLIRKGGATHYLWKVIKITHRETYDSLLVEYVDDF